MARVLNSLFRRTISVLVFELVEHLVLPVLALAVGRLLIA